MAATSSRKNAFTYFVEEYEAEQIARGRNMTRKQVLDECAWGWGELDPETRLRYCNMANPMLDRAGKSRDKTPANMEWLDPVTGEYGEKWLRYVRSGDELYYLKSAVTSGKRLKRFSFYLVHFNYFCKPSLKKYVPAELALVEFNLGEGIKNVYHTLINPGSIPLGFAHEAKRLSQEGHGIPIPPHSRGERDMGKIVDTVKRFLKYGTGPTGKFPPLFTVTDNVLPAMHMLNDMVPYNEDQPVFTVYPAHRMFYWIKSKCSDICGRGAGFLDESFALKEIERDCFRYIVEIACDIFAGFHYVLTHFFFENTPWISLKSIEDGKSRKVGESDWIFRFQVIPGVFSKKICFHKQSETRFPMCSQSIAKRLAFTICDHCCRDLNITLVGGRHMHRNFGDSDPEEKSEGEEECKKEAQETEDTEDTKDTQGTKETKETKETQDTRDTQGTQDTQETKERKEPETGNVDEPEEDTSLEKALARHCNCGEIPDFVGGYSTKEVPADDLVGLNAEEIQLFYNAFMHNLMEGKVKFDFEEEEKRDEVYLKATELDLADNPFASPQVGRRDGSLPTAADEVEAFRRQESRKIRNIIIARMRAREALKSREVFESKIAEVVRARTNGQRVKLVREHEK